MSQRSARAWLVKSEPEEFSFDDLWAAPGRRTMWDGVRNYQARNTLRDLMQIGDAVLFYHSNAEPSGVVGLAQVAGRPYPDPTQFDPAHAHFDPAASDAKPIWYALDILAVERFPRVVTLGELKDNARLAKMVVVQRGSRLSVQPVTGAEFDEVVRMASRAPKKGTSGAR